MIGHSKKNASIFILVILIVLNFGATDARSETSPTLNDGRKWRIGYYEGGSYSEYVETMKTLVQGLMDLGWIEKQTIPFVSLDAGKPYWDWLAQGRSPYLSFQKTDAYSAEWNASNRAEIKTELLKRLKAGELDLVIAMGTWAGQDLATNRHQTPTMVLSTSDPIKAGIIKSAADSGLDHVTARVDQTRYLRQIKMFHRIVGFKTMGVVFEDWPEGPIYSALSEARQVARERGFKVVTCKSLAQNVDQQTANRTCLDCFRQLAKEVDAIYVTALNCVDLIPQEIIQTFIEAKKPSFSQMGSNLVMQGIMLSISSDSGYMGLGKYNAEKFAMILNGAKPRSLPMVFEDPLDIAVNLETARRIGFKIPNAIMKIASEIYYE